MKVNLLILFLSSLFFTLGCSKDDKMVKVEYTVIGGNEDGTMSYLGTGIFSEVLDQKGPIIRDSRTYKRDGTNMIMLLYHTANPVKEGFRMSIKVDGKVYENYHLSTQSKQYTYEIDLPHKI